MVTAATIASWNRRLDEQGPDALVQTRQPVNRFPDFVAVIVQQLKATLPSIGKVRIAQLLARAGLTLAPATVARMLKQKAPREPEPEPSTAKVDSTGKTTNKKRSAKTVKRVVSARYPHHLWHIDLTILPTGPGFWVPWWPFSWGLCWPFCAWAVVVLDHFSRAVVAKKVFDKQPSTQQICALLDSAIREAGRAPRHIVSDQGAQLQERYRAWCRKKSVWPSFGAIGQHGSIAIIERFFRSLKDECFANCPSLCLFQPFRPNSMPM